MFEIQSLARNVFVVHIYVMHTENRSDRSTMFNAEHLKHIRLKS